MFGFVPRNKREVPRARRKILYGSVSSNLAASCSSLTELGALGSLLIPATSGLVAKSRQEKVQFQSPPTIIDTFFAGVKILSRFKKKVADTEFRP